MRELSKTERAVSEMALPVAEKMGLDILDVKLEKRDGVRVLSVVIDKRGGVGIDDCADLSLAVEPLLDEADIISRSYNLEVTSPGIDRPLETDRDMERNIGELVEVKLKIHYEKRLKFEGILKSFTKDEITVELDEPFVKGVKPKTNGQEREFSRKDLKSLKRAIRF